jgi:hypothetical protein
LRSVTFGRLRSTTCTSSMGGLRWGLRHRLARNAALPASSMGLPVKPVQYLFPMAQEAAPMVERQLSLAGFAEIASKLSDRIRWEMECESFLVHSRKISHSLRLSQSVISDSATGRRLPVSLFDNGFLTSRRRRRGCADVVSVLCFPPLHSLFFLQNPWEYLGFPKNP